MTISSEIINILNYLGQKFGVVIDWNSKNVIPYVQKLIEKYISWEIATSTTWGIIAGVMILVCIAFIIVEIKIDTCWLLGTIGVGLGFFGIIVLCVQIFDIIRCTYFPELQVLEYIKYLSQNYSLK